MITPESKIYSVSEITQAIKSTLEGVFPSLWMVGEISNLSQPRSGHIYLTLKDSGAQISAAIWRNTASSIRFDLRDGQEVQVFGRITVYPPHGKYQIIVERIRPKGIGALQLAFQQLREKLQKEGLFDSEHKRPLPFLPRRIGIITSPTGAAIRDILTVLRRRFPSIRATLYPVRVQGEGAAAEIVEAIETLNSRGGFEVLIVGRGGGSIEDLWAFNEEIVARALFASRIPIISAVGHETDFTIADFVADRRALTPTEAAELAVPVQDDLLDRLRMLRNSLKSSLLSRIHQARLRLKASASSYALRQPIELVRQKQQRIDELTQRLGLAMQRRTSEQTDRLRRLAEVLDSLSPMNVLNRGYTLTVRPENGEIIRDAAAVSSGETIKTILHSGRLVSRVLEALPSQPEPQI